MRIPFRHLAIRMTESLLNLVQRSSAVDQERCVLMAQIVQSKMRQRCLVAQSSPDTIHRRQWCSSTYAWVSKPFKFQMSRRFKPVWALVHNALKNKKTHVQHGFFYCLSSNDLKPISLQEFAHKFRLKVLNRLHSHAHQFDGCWHSIRQVRALVHL